MTQKLNSLGLFISFFFGRLFFQYYITFWFICPWVWNVWFYKEGVDPLYKALLVEISFGVAINVLMNNYWGYLILR